MLSNLLKSSVIVVLGASLLWAAPEKSVQKQRPQNLPVVGGSHDPAVNLRVAPQRATRNSLDDYVGTTYTAGTTWYDYQHTGSCGKMIDVDAAGMVSVVWMNALDESLFNRYVYYNVWDPSLDDFMYDTIGIRIDASYRAGYACQTTRSDGFCFPAFHQIIQTNGNAHATSAIDYIAYIDAFTMIEPAWCYEGGDDMEIIWPKIDMDIIGNLHMVSSENPFDGLSHRIYYSRGVPEFDASGFGIGIDWDPMNCGGFQLWDTVMTIAPDVACSRHSQRCAAAWCHSMDDLSDDPSQHNNEIYLRISEDGGLNWGELINVTNFIPWDPECYYGGGDPLDCDNDTLRAYTDVSILFDEDDLIHIAFTTLGFWWYLPGESDSGWISTRQSLIWHWGEEDCDFSLLADGWYPAYDPGAWQRNVQRPSLAVDPVTGYLYCSYQQYDTTTYSESGYPMADAFVTVSTDNGNHWAVGTNVTNTTPNVVPVPTGESMHERDITLAPLVTEYGGVHYIHMEYILDRDAGGLPQEEGWATLNPVIYQRISTDEIATWPLMPERTFHAGEEDDENVGYVTLISPGPPDWGYRLHWVSGSLSRLVFTNFCSGTEGSVSGDAGAAGWTATNYGDSIAFTTALPLTSGSIETFWLSHPYCSDYVTWQAGDSLGTVEGPLPVELTTFQAFAGDGQVTLRWHTASEQDNDHFVLYKRRSGQEDFNMLAEIRGQGTTTEPHDYDYVDCWVQNGVTYEYQISDVDIAGHETFYEQIISATPRRDAVPLEFALHPNWPNPFNPTTTIRYDVKETGLVSLKIFDLLGREVATLADRDHTPSSYTITWDATGFPSGVYLCRMDAERFVQVRKLLLVK